MRLRAGNRHGAGSTPGAYSETISPLARDLRRQRRMRARVVAVDAATEHGDRRPASQRAAVRGAVDRRARGPRRRARLPRQVTRERRCDRRRRSASTRVRRRSRRRRDRAAQGCATPRMNRPGGGSWIERRRAGNARSQRASQRKPPSASSAQERRLVERRAERREPGRARRVEQMRIGLRGEDCESRARSFGQLPRRPVRERLADVLGLDRVGLRERSDRRGDPRDTCASATGERQPLDRARQQLVGLVVSHRQAFPQAPRARRAHAPAPAPRPRRARRRARAPRGRGTVSSEVEAVEERPRELLAVALDALRRARALRSAGSPRAPHGHRFIVANELKARREDGAPADARNVRRTRPRAAGAAPRAPARGNSGSSSRKSTPRCARLASPGRDPAVAAADQPGRRRRVVRRAERRHAHQTAARREHAARPNGSASPRAPPRRRAAAGSPAAAARASSCRCPAAPRAAGCGRRPRRSRARAARAPGPARRRGPGRRRATRSRRSDGGTSGGSRSPRR